MQYRLLTTEQLLSLTKQRVAQLEADHYTNALILREVTSPEEAAPIMERQEEIERRITIHLADQTPGQEVVSDGAGADQR